MKKFIIIVIFFFTGICLYGQNQTDPIEIKQGFLGSLYSQNGKFLVTSQIQIITQSNPAASKEMKIARNAEVAVGVLGSGGILMFTGALICDALIKSGNMKPFNTKPLLFAGLGSIVVGIPIAFVSDKHTKNAVLIYNKGLSSSSLTNAEIKMVVSFNNIGLEITF